MRRILTLTVAALALSAVPATAEEAGPATSPCPANKDFVRLGLAGREQTFAPKPVPSAGHDIREEPYSEDSVTRFFYRLDVSGSAATPSATGATVELALEWDDPGDLDLYAYDSSGNELASSSFFNPRDGTGETVTLGAVAHCADLRIDVVNYLALPTKAVTLDASVRNLKP